jgi:hypothetical protein
MAWRFHQCITHGEIDNTERGRVTGKLWLIGREEPVILDLDGDAWPDLAGSKLTFVNTCPQLQPEKIAGLSMRQTGSVGDMTASQKRKKLLVPEEVWMKAIEERRFHEIPWVLANSLYLEWFSGSNGRVVIQTCDYTLTISEKHWQPDEHEQAAQAAINEDNMRAYMEELGRAMGGDAQSQSPDETK